MATAAGYPTPRDRAISAPILSSTINVADLLSPTARRQYQQTGRAYPKDFAVEIEFHRFALIFPEIKGSRADELDQSIINTGGPLEAITLYFDPALNRWFVLDGRNRWLSCLRTSMPAKFRIWDGDSGNPFRYVMDLNFHRRHLETGQVAAMMVEVEREVPEIVAQARTLTKTEGKRYEDNFITLADGIIGGKVSRSSFMAARDIAQYPATFNGLLGGTLTIAEAQRDIQREKGIIANGRETMIFSVPTEEVSLINERLEWIAFHYPHDDGSRRTRHEAFVLLCSFGTVELRKAGYTGR